MKKFNTPELVTVAEAAQIAKCSLDKIYDRTRNGNLTKITINNRIMLYRTEVERLITPRQSNKALPFGDIYLDFDESAKPLTTLNNPYADPWERYMTDYQYLVTNQGRIINLNTGNILTGVPGGENEHLQLNIYVCGKQLTIDVHRLVALMWCHNGKHKPIVHHIDKVKENNSCQNLIWVTGAEHRELHKLFDAGMMDKYWEMIAQISNDNTILEPIYPVLHPDFEGNGNYVYVLYITHHAHEILVNGGDWDDIPSKDILCEYAFQKSDCPEGVTAIG